jgi:hypothetical protein
MFSLRFATAKGDPTCVAHAVGDGDPIDGPLQVVTDGRWRVEEHNAVTGGQKRRLVHAIGDPIEVSLHAPDASNAIAAPT